MAFKPKQTFILSLGGSLIVPSKIDIEFLKKFKAFIEGQVKLGNRFVIVTGGGATARQYRDGGIGVIKKMADEDLDWLGIHATRLNGHLLRTIFRGIAHPQILTNPDEGKNFKEAVIIGAGYLPGHSTDYDAVLFAKKFGAKTIINLSNIDYVYTKDPKESGAEKIEKINWTNFRKIVGGKWSPSSHAPFDPIASKFAHELGLKVVVLNGKNLSNLKNVVSGKGKFVGTIIEGK